MTMPYDAVSELSDEALLVLYAKGDPLAAQVLSRRFLPRVLAHATRVLKDQAEAEDVAQEAMLRLWKIAPDWRAGEAQVTTWMYRVTANLCTDRIRKRRSVPLDSAPEPEDDTPSAGEAMQDAARAQALNAALMELPDRQRQAVALRHLEGLSNPDIAEILDCGVEAVESLIARGKRALTKILQGKREELGYVDE
ncbi:RNA polymerase sigma factor [Donghicola eburneus]|uniref:RNA polymerase sigma factor n=1 Tax=Donghicola eburneus TaxID=393278 RepID=A0A1M4MX75_9RHOB|nr:RNA polymerase sigma factor [Donghicola eburneus]SCM67153.1 RNA polymerase sigma factor [Donghicola eburneus]SFQ68952.1 RNA polymerase, sigma subunit, ECF family [Donghicola eburneus]